MSDNTGLLPEEGSKSAGFWDSVIADINYCEVVKDSEYPEMFLFITYLLVDNILPNHPTSKSQFLFSILVSYI